MTSILLTSHQTVFQSGVSAIKIENAMNNQNRIHSFNADPEKSVCLDTNGLKNVAAFRLKAAAYRKIEISARALGDRQLEAIAAQKAQSYDNSIYKAYQRGAYDLAVSYGHIDIAENIIRGGAPLVKDRFLPESLILALDEIELVNHLKPKGMVVS